MEPNRKSNYSYIERVNDHRSCYRIKTNDGLKLELDKSEIGRFIPQKGMSVQIRLFNGTVLQEVFLNGICVVRRSPQKLLDILAGLSAELRKAQDECEKFSALENSDGYLNLPLAFRHRLQLLKLIMQKDLRPQQWKNRLSSVGLLLFCRLRPMRSSPVSNVTGKSVLAILCRFQN